jgi:hypothetical protein
MRNPYHTLACVAGTPDALELADAITAWHDRMVAHIRQHGATPPPDCCPEPDACPGAEARRLWLEAREAFAARAHALTFLQAQAAARVQ